MGWGNELTAFPVGHFSLKMLHLNFHPFYMHDLDLGTHKDASKLQEPSCGGGPQRLEVPHWEALKPMKTQQMWDVWKPPLAG